MAIATAVRSASEARHIAEAIAPAPQPSIDTRSAQGRTLGALVAMYEREVQPFEAVGLTDLSRAPHARPHFAQARVVRFDHGTPIRRAECAHCDWAGTEYAGGTDNSPQARDAQREGQQHEDIATEAMLAAM